MKKPRPPDTTELEKQIKDSNDRMRELIDAQNRAAEEAERRAAEAAEEQARQLASQRAASEAQLKASEARIKKMEEEAAAKELEAKQKIKSREMGRRKGRPTLLTEMLQTEEPAGKKKTLLGE